MRGEVLDYDGDTGSGLISGDDGVRYSFGRADLTRPAILRRGVRVDFVAEGEIARGIFISNGWQGGAAPEDLDVWSYFVRCMRLYFNGRGRARRKEYWSFMLFRWLFMVALLVIGSVGIGIASAARAATGTESSPAMSALFMLVGFILGLPFMAPLYAVSARRLHDVGMTGWLALLMLVPYLGGIFMFIVALIPSQMAENRYGPCPIGTKLYS